MINKKTLSIDVFHNATIVPYEGNKGNTGRKAHLDAVVKHISIDGYILEFGVRSGETINRISKLFPTDTIWGFDSFEGLPENWVMRGGEITHPKGTFSTVNLPEVNTNVKLVKGWFNQVLPKWTTKNLDPVKFLHLDADLYSSTKDVLTILNNQIIPGTIIVFDEMYHWKYPHRYTLWEEGEYRALKEWLTEFDREFIPVLRSRYMQCSIKITK